MRSRRHQLLVALVFVAVGLAPLAWLQSKPRTSSHAVSDNEPLRFDGPAVIAVARKDGAPTHPPPAIVPGERVTTAMTPSRASREEEDDFAAQLACPEAERLLANQQAVRVDARFAPLFPRLALSPDQLAQFKQLLADKLLVPIDALTASRRLGVDLVRDPAALRRLEQDAQAELDHQIEALLDAGRYDQYQAYLRTELQYAH